MLVDGDGSLYQHIQELETISVRASSFDLHPQRWQAIGAETHTISAPMGSTRCTRRTAGRHRPDRPRLRLQRDKGDSHGQFDALFREHAAGTNSSLWDVHIDDFIPSRNYRRVHYPANVTGPGIALVGWAERSEAHRFPSDRQDDGLRCAQPILRQWEKTG